MSFKASQRPAAFRNAIAATALIGGVFTLVLVSRWLLPGVMEEFTGERAAPGWAASLLQLHIVGGVVAMVTGCWNAVASKPSDRSGGLHRVLGKAYVIAVLVSSAAALGVVGYVPREWNGHIAMALLSSLWILSAVMLWRAARQGHLARHRRWAVRAMALTFAAASLRLQLLVAMLLTDDPMAYYGLILWTCWLPNLIVAQWLIARLWPVSRA